MITMISTKRELWQPIAAEGVTVLVGAAPPTPLEGVIVLVGLTPPTVSVGMTPPTVPVGMIPPTVPVAMIPDVAPPAAPDEVKVVMVGLTVPEEQELVMLHDESFKSL